MLFEQLVDPVTVYEVSPRDGLQNESAIVGTPDKVELVRALLSAGLRRIEATSFVSPKWIPQLADAEALLQALAGDGRGDAAQDPRCVVVFPRRAPGCHAVDAHARYTRNRAGQRAGRARARAALVRRGHWRTRRLSVRTGCGG